MVRGGVVSVPSEMALHHGFDSLSLKVWPRKCPMVEQHFPNVFGEVITVPNSEMGELVSPQEKAFKMQRRNTMVDSRQPLWHPAVICVFGLERELEKIP